MSVVDTANPNLGKPKMSLAAPPRHFTRERAEQVSDLGLSEQLHQRSTRHTLARRGSIDGGLQEGEQQQQFH